MKTKGKSLLLSAAMLAAGGLWAAQADLIHGGPSSPEARTLVQLPSTSPSTMAAPDGELRTASLMTPQHISEVGGYRYDWSDLQAAIDADDEIPNGYFIVGNASDSAFLFAYEKGSFGPDRVTHLASASKWFIGALTVRMAQAAIVDLDDGMRPALPYWSLAGNKKDVKLKHLISMTSGFNGSPLVGGCQLTPSLLLYNCAKNIHDLRYDILRPGNAPGAQFSYGPHAMQIAAAYLEAKDISLEPSATPARERNLHELFAQHVTQPLGMASTSWYDPSGSAPTNAWIAGGAYSTAQDYAKLLRAFLGGSFIDDMAAFTQSRTSGLPRIFVPAPAASWEYALGSFVECSASTSCATSQINSSPGAYGWLGWIDRENEYYGLIATELASAGDRKSVELEQQMQPLIEAAIASRTPI